MNNKFFVMQQFLWSSNRKNNNISTLSICLASIIIITDFQFCVFYWFKQQQIFKWIIDNNFKTVS